MAPPGGTILDLLEAFERKVAIEELGDAGLELRAEAGWEEIQAAQADHAAAEEEAERLAEVVKELEPLRRLGVVIPDTVSLDDAEQLARAWHDLRDSLAELRSEFGFAPDVPSGLSVAQFYKLGDPLGALWGELEHWDSRLHDFVEDEDIPRMPDRRERQAVIPELLGRIRQGTWTGSIEQHLWLAQRAVGGDVPEGTATGPSAPARAWWQRLLGI